MDVVEQKEGGRLVDQLSTNITKEVHEKIEPILAQYGDDKEGKT